MARTSRAVAVVLALVVSASQARAEDLKILSAGALEPAMAALADGFRRQSGNAVRVEFATAAEIRERGGAALTVELVAAPQASIAELARAGRITGVPAALGRVGLGVVVPAAAAADRHLDRGGLADGAPCREGRRLQPRVERAGHRSADSNARCRRPAGVPHGPLS